MKTLNKKEFAKLPDNTPKKMKIGEYFIMNESGNVERREPKIGERVCVMEVIRLTQMGFESKMTWVTIIK